MSPNLSLNRMESIDFYLSQIINGDIPIGFFEAVSRKITDLPPLFGFWYQLFAGAIANGMCAIAFFNTGWEAMWVATAIGLVVIGPLNYLASKFPAFSLISSPATAFFSGFICRSMVVAGVLPRACLRGTELSCIINNAPGISLALAALELSSRQVSPNRPVVL